jgi:hypothetical protein
VYRIRKEANANKDMLSSPKTLRKRTFKSKEYDNFTKSAIWAKVYEFFFRKEISMPNKILAAINSGADLLYLSATTLHNPLSNDSSKC